MLHFKEDFDLFFFLNFFLLFSQNFTLTLKFRLYHEKRYSLKFHLSTSDILLWERKLQDLIQNPYSLIKVKKC